MNDYDKATLILEKIIEILPGGIHEDEQYMYVAAIEDALEEMEQNSKEKTFVAIRSNKQYKITEIEKQKYIDAGYRIATLEGDEIVFEQPEEIEEDEQIIELKARIRELEELLDATKE